MRLSVEEVTRLVGLKGRDQILLYLAAHTRSQWWATARELASIVGVPLRRARLELVELASKGLLERKGTNGIVARFRIASNLDQSDPGTRIKVIQVPGSKRSGSSSSDARASGSLSGSGSHGTTRPSVLGGPGGEEPAADGRTDGGDGDRAEPRAALRNALLAWVEKRHAVEPRLSTPGLMRLLNAGATEHELRAFLTDGERGSHPCFDGLEHADFRFGAMCTEARFAKWRASRARAQPPIVDVEPPRPRRSVSAVSTREIEEFVRNKLRR